MYKISEKTILKTSHFSLKKSFHIKSPWSYNVTYRSALQHLFGFRPTSEWKILSHISCFTNSHLITPLLLLQFEFYCFRFFSFSLFLWYQNVVHEHRAFLSSSRYTLCHVHSSSVKSLHNLLASRRRQREREKWVWKLLCKIPCQLTTHNCRRCMYNWMCYLYGNY